MTPKTRLTIRIVSGMGKIAARQIAFLEAIESQGSISGAGRFTGLSYPGARLMIDAINKALRESAVSTTMGGHKRGGATLTPVGTQLVGLYRAIEVRIQAVAVPEREALLRLMRAKKITHR
jgi:molybdate transport system regulatory protein